MTPDACVREMREVVHQETKLTVSAGIAPNKVRIIIVPNVLLTSFYPGAHCSQDASQGLFHINNRSQSHGLNVYSDLLRQGDVILCGHGT